MILLINGHPNAESFCFGLAASYKQCAVTAEVEEISIRDLNFNANLENSKVSKRDRSRIRK
jgi:putative NADPH-quinone reductase